METKYKVGDIVELNGLYDYLNKIECEGQVLIIDIIYDLIGELYYYKFKILKGYYRSEYCPCRYLDRSEVSYWVTNINEDETARILYE